MSHDEGNLYAFLVFGFGAGLFSFFKGFRTYRAYRIIEDTPEIPIRSIPMGLIHIHGKAWGVKPILSPVSHTPCLLYKVEIEKWKKERNRGSWSKYRTDVNSVRFYLDDGSDQVLVDAREAELDLAEACKREAAGDHNYEMQTSADSSSLPVAGIEASEAELLSYVNQVSTAKVFSFLGRRLESLGPPQDPQPEVQREAVLDFFKHPFDPDSMQQVMASMQPLSDPDQERARHEIMEALKHPVWSPEFEQHIQQAGAAAHAGPEEMLKFREHVQSWQRFRESGVFFNAPPASGRYRFTEYCILPDQDYDVTGTCVENPEAKGERDRNLIAKGRNEPTFLISYRTEREVESRLRNRAALMVFGGGAGAVVCLGLLLAKLGWL